MRLFCQTVFDVQFRRCVLIILIASYVLTRHHVCCSFIRRLINLSVSPMYTCPQKQGILYTPAELSGSLWSLGFLKIYSISLGGLKIVRILYLFNILPIRFVPLTYGRMDRIFSSDCVSDNVVLFAYLLIVLIISFIFVSVFL